MEIHNSCRGETMSVSEKVIALKITLIVLAALAAVGLIAFAVISIKRNYVKKKETAYFISKLHHTVRNDILDRAIADSHGRGESNYWLVRIVEINQFGETEHFFNLNDGDVSIGHDFNSNKLCLFDESIADHQCKVVLSKESPGIMNVSPNGDTVFNIKKKHKRELPKNYVMRESETLKLYTYDSVSFGDTKLVFYLYNNILGLI